MFFLLRAAFWLTIVLALLPSGGSQPTAGGPKVGEAVSAAGAVISDLRHFCTREREACVVGTQTAVMIGQRAQAGAKMLYDMFSEHGAPAATGSVSGAKTPGTLTATDHAPAWRGGERR
jgi:hypothetical protein